MIGAVFYIVISTAILYLLLRIFERKRIDLDPIRIASVPALAITAAVVVAGVLWALGQPMRFMGLPGLAFIIAAFFALLKVVGLSLARSAIYTVVMLVVQPFILALF